MRRSSARVLGPYPNGDKWRLVVIDGAARKSVVVDSYERALSTRDDLQTALLDKSGRLFGEALDEYEDHLQARGVLSHENNVKMLRGFFPLDEPLHKLDAERAGQLYLAETRRKKENGALIATDTHHLLLRRAKCFYKWALSRRHVEVNPFAEVQPVGRPRRGKPQLRIDEARKLVEVALRHGQTLDVGATAALMQIFLGLRPTEAVVRIVRDLDDEGRVLWIAFGKTHNARRRLQVPEALRQILLKHAAGKPPEAPLLGPPGEPLHTRVIVRYRLHKLCEEAGLPQVCPHSLRGLNATLAVEAGATAHHVAAALGHASFATTARHYADASAIANASLRKVADVLAGSRGSANGFANGFPSGISSGSANGRPDVAQVAALLRTELSGAEIAELRELLALPLSGTDFAGKLTRIES